MAVVRVVEIGEQGGPCVRVGSGLPLAWIAGPCVVEDRDTMARTAETLKGISQRSGIPLVFKSSFEKDNRSSEEYYSGPGIDRGLEILAWIRREFELPVLSDVHRVEDLAAAGQVLDVVQIPAFLSRQTSLLVAAAKTGATINVKKGQFLAPDEMGGVVGKLERSGCSRILLTERGACFGYKQLVADMTALPLLQSYGYPVVFDAGHQVRRSGIPSSDPAGGAPEFIPTLLRASVAAGANAVFLETHPSPRDALCDAASQFPLDQMEKLMGDVQAIAQLIREQGCA